MLERANATRLRNITNVYAHGLDESSAVFLSRQIPFDPTYQYVVNTYKNS